MLHYSPDIFNHLYVNLHNSPVTLLYKLIHNLYKHAVRGLNLIIEHIEQFTLISNIYIYIIIILIIIILVISSVKRLTYYKEIKACHCMR